MKCGFAKSCCSDLSGEGRRRVGRGGKQREGGGGKELNKMHEESLNEHVTS